MDIKGYVLLRIRFCRSRQSASRDEGSRANRTSDASVKHGNSQCCTQNGVEHTHSAKQTTGELKANSKNLGECAVVTSGTRR